MLSLNKQMDGADKQGSAAGPAFNRGRKAGATVLSAAIKADFLVFIIRNLILKT